MTRAEELENLIANVIQEINRSELKNGRGYASMHEAFAVLLEEVDELKNEVWKRSHNRSGHQLRSEALQIAAIALRIAEDCMDPKHLKR